MKSLFKYLGVNLLITLCYFSIAKLGLLLAIPPGFATAIWPASGLALFALIRFGPQTLLGIFLGHFLVNVSVSLNLESTSLILKSILIASSIACGGMLQSLLGYILIKHFLGLKDCLSSQKAIIYFCTLAGPISCLIASSIGVTTLYFFYLIESTNFLYSWTTWWIGDSMGVIIFTPIFLALFGQPKEIWRPKVYNMAIPLLIVFCLSVFFFFFARKSLNNEFEDKFKDEVHNISKYIDHSIAEQLIILNSLKSFHHSNPQLNEEAFRSFTQGFLQNHKHIFALSWNPFISNELRGPFETQLSQELNQPSHIKSKSSSGEFITSPKRDYYVPVQYIQPFDLNFSAIGFDVASEPIRRFALEKSISSGSAAISEAIQLVQYNQSQNGFLIFLPIYKNNSKQEQPLGFYVCVITLKHIMKDIDNIFRSDFISFTLSEFSNQNENIIYSNSNSTEPLKGLYSESIQVVDRTWEINANPTPLYDALYRNWKSWILLSLGMLFSCFFCVFLLFQSCRTQQIKDLVIERTEDLSKEIELRKEVEKQIILEKKAAESAAHSKSQFLANMSHEIRTPLNGILGMLHLIESDEKNNASLLEKVHIARSSSETLLTIINDILDLSKLENGEIPFKHEPFNLSKFTEESVRFFQAYPDAKRNHNQINFSFKGNYKDFVLGDKNRINQVLFNLIGNSIKFTKSGFIQVQLICKTNAYNNVDIEYIVQDNGIGIPKKDQARIFERFTQAKESVYQPSGGGTGLGLSIVKLIVHYLDGSIDLDSDIGLGTKITVKFSLQKTHSSSRIPLQPDPKSQLNSESTKNRAKLLVAEDNETNQVVIAEFLKKLQLEYILAKNGQEAVELAQEQSFDLILMDIQMPILDGIQATLQIRQKSPFNRETPIIAITAGALKEEQEQYLKSGINHILLKPIMIDSLAHCLQQFSIPAHRKDSKSLLG